MAFGGNGPVAGAELGYVVAAMEEENAAVALMEEQPKAFRPKTQPRARSWPLVMEPQHYLGSGLERDEVERSSDVQEDGGGAISSTPLLQA